MRGELQPSNHRVSGLVDVLDRVLDKGLAIAGDIKISLAEVELLTIRIRLIVCSIDKAQEIGLDWWKYDPHLAPGRPGAIARERRASPAARGPGTQGRAALGERPAPGRAPTPRHRRNRSAGRPQEEPMPVERTSGGTSLIDVLDRVLDKGIVIDAWVRVSLVGIDLITVEARVVVASIDTYLKYSEAVGQVVAGVAAGAVRQQDPRSAARGERGAARPARRQTSAPATCGGRRRRATAHGAV